VCQIDFRIFNIPNLGYAISLAKLGKFYLIQNIERSKLFSKRGVYQVIPNNFYISYNIMEESFSHKNYITCSLMPVSETKLIYYTLHKLI
jgi:hypothetical protein